jgi:hypothetical protein
MSQPLHLDDLFELPESVHSGDFVLVLGSDDQTQKILDDYVVTSDLAERFDDALAIIKKALFSNSSKSSYLDGSFGSGKSHFMAVLREILRHNPAVRGKSGLIDTIAKHNSWLEGKKFFQLAQHMIDARSLETAVLGGYVKAVRQAHPDAPLPAVYRDDLLLADAAALRARMGDEAFIAGLPAKASAETNAWGADLAGVWTSESLDAAFDADADAEHSARRNLVSALAASYFTNFTAMAATKDSYIDLDTGLSVISHHAAELGYDAIVLLLDELVLWQSKFIGNDFEMKNQGQKMSKLVESAETSRPAPIIGFIPRQRDLRELVAPGVGNDSESIFDTLKHWDSRFERISLADTNLPAVVSARLLTPKSDAAAMALTDAFKRTRNNRPEVWDALLDSDGGRSSVADFKATYPFSPAFMHTIVDVSSALQRERTALKLILQLLVNHRDMPVGSLMPIGTIFEVLIDNQDRPFTDRLRTEFERIRNFYIDEVRPWLLDRHKLTEDVAKGLSARHGFRADDMVVKTLMMSALVPRVPALNNLTSSRLAALNQGAIAAPIPGAEKQKVAKTLRDLSAAFGAFHVTGADDPQVTVQLLEVDVKALLENGRRKSGDRATERRRAIKQLLWHELSLGSPDPKFTNTTVTWRGTNRPVEVVFTNIRQMSQADLRSEEPERIRMVIDYPFDEESTFSPADDRRVIEDARKNITGPPPLSIGWLPAFFTEARLADLANFVTIDYLLGSESRLAEAGPHLTGEERADAQIALRSQRDGLRDRIIAAMKQAYGVNKEEPTDVEPHPDQRVLGLDEGWEHRPGSGAALADAFKQMVVSLLDNAYPDHPNLSDPGRERPYKKAELDIVWHTVEAAAKDPNKRAEITKDERSVLIRIAAPLHIGTVNEGSMVLPEEWRSILNGRAENSGHPDEVSVAHIRDWIGDQTPGLPRDIVDLLVMCYAIEDDRTWVRGGATIPIPKLSGLAADMRLRKQPLPDRAVFDLAAERAVKIFEAEPRPAYNSRSVAAMSRTIREALHRRRQSVTDLKNGLVAHTTTLGLTESSPRLDTANRLAELFASLSAADGDLDLFARLSAADLSQEAGVYRRTLLDAAKLAALLNGDPNTWTILDGLTSDTSAEAGRILNRLREAGAADQHQVDIEPVIRDCVSAATTLLVRQQPSAGSGLGPSPHTVGEPASGSGRTDQTAHSETPGTSQTITRRAKAAQLRTAFPDLAATIEDGEYEIVLRKVGPA